FLWRWRTSEKQSRLVATGDYAPSILSPWRAAVVTVSNYGDITAQVVNFIPDQRAPAIVRDTVGGTWGAVDPVSYASTTTANVHIIGDSQATSQPKAGLIANSEAKVCADAIVRSLMPAPMLPYAYPMTNSACFTPINANEAAWISAVYKYNGSAIVTEKVGNSPTYNKENHELMFDWANNLFSDTFG
ncbi:FCSD flavin-binding domain-containing protein, partial [Solemya elarraichensis gill symbiont]